MSEPIYNSAGEVLYPGLAGDGAGYRESRLVTLTPESWEEAKGAWPLMQDAPVPEAKTGYVALGSYPDNYGAAAQEAGCPAYCEARDGFVRFYARAKPSGDIRVQVTLLGEAGGAVVTGLVAGSGVRVDDTLTISGAAADAKVVGETLRTVTVTVNEKLQAASDDTNAKLDKLKKSISEKGRLVAAGRAWSGGEDVALPEETDYVILRFAANTWYNNSSSNGHVERTSLCWPEEGFLLARGGVVYLNLHGLVDEQLVSASFKSDGWLYITSGDISSLKINWEGYHYI